MMLGAVKSRCLRCAPVCAVSPKSSSGQRSMPYIIYTQNKKEVNPIELAQLLQMARQPWMESGSAQRRTYFQHWHPGANSVDKLAKALDNSLAVVAAFTNTDVYPSSTWASQTEAASSRSGSRDGAHEAQSSSSNSSSSSGGWPVWPLQQQASMAGRSSRRKHSLVGFARAAGDGSLAASIYDVAVHPDFRRCGVGKKLVRVLVQNLYNKAIYDIGTVVPTELDPFFRSLYFEEDREESQTMSFVSHHSWVEEGLWDGRPQVPEDNTQNWAMGSSASQSSYDSIVLSSSMGSRSSSYDGSSSSGSSSGYGSMGFISSRRTSTLLLSGPDPLAAVPTPATQEVRNSVSLHQLLQRKLEQRLGPVKQHAGSSNCSGSSESVSQGSGSQARGARAESAWTYEI